MAKIQSFGANLFRLCYHWMKLRLQPSGQSDEANLVKKLAGPTKTFVEFGFHPTQFNCIGLIKTHRGLLIDGDRRRATLGNKLLPSSIEVRSEFLNLDNIDAVGSHFPKVGVLSIDVDGNDYWFLERLLRTSPELICVEYNASFGHESVTVPYDPAFMRHSKHSSGWYHGASLVALAKLCAGFGYGLAAVSAGGGNAFFTRSGSLDAQTVYRECTLRNTLSKTSAQQQWETIRHLPLIKV